MIGTCLGFCRLRCACRPILLSCMSSRSPFESRVWKLTPEVLFLIVLVIRVIRNCNRCVIIVVYVNYNWLSLCLRLLKLSQGAWTASTWLLLGEAVALSLNHLRFANLTWILALIKCSVLIIHILLLFNRLTCWSVLLLLKSCISNLNQRSQTIIYTLILNKLILQLVPRPDLARLWKD